MSRQPNATLSDRGLYDRTTYVRQQIRRAKNVKHGTIEVNQR